MAVPFQGFPGSQKWSSLVYISIFTKFEITAMDISTSVRAINPQTNTILPSIDASEKGKFCKSSLRKGNWGWNTDIPNTELRQLVPKAFCSSYLPALCCSYIEPMGCCWSSPWHEECKAATQMKGNSCTSSTSQMGLNLALYLSGLQAYMKTLHLCLSFCVNAEYEDLIVQIVFLCGKKT